MAFNWRDFAAGALETATAEIDEKSADAKAYKQRERDSARRNASVIQTRGARAQQASAIGKQAMNLMSELPQGEALKYVQTAMSSGMGTITDLYEKLNNAANAPGQGGKLGADDIEAIISMPDLPTTVYEGYADVSLQEFANLTYGAKARTPVATPEDDTSLIGKLFGYGDMDSAKRELAAEQYGSGMTVAEINALAEGNEYESLIPGATMTFKDADPFEFNQKTDFTKAIIDAQNDAIERNESLITSIEPADRPAIREQLRQDAAKGIVELYVDRYKNSGILEDEFALKQIKDATPEGFLNEMLLANGKITQEQFDAAAAASRGEGPPTVTAIDPVTGEPTATEPTATEPVVTEPIVTTDSSNNVGARPAGGARGQSRERVAWNKKYKGKYDPVTGDAIVVPPRPAPDETRTETKLISGRVVEINLASEWDDEYEDTHDPVTGQPLSAEE